ncbi:MAG: D-TA family PLP-dependent enzyme [Cyclobacteriaceae bacterium]
MDWFEVKNAHEIASPSLLVFPERIEKNIDTMVKMAGVAERLRPHVKTYKCPQVVKMQLEKGINKFKCSTIAEAEMLANCGVKDILLAYQPVGPNIQRFSRLSTSFSEVLFSAIVDHGTIASQLSKEAMKYDISIPVYIDIDSGMHRTGIAATKAPELYNQIKKLPGVKYAGLHIYDGHIRDDDFDIRKTRSDDQFEAVNDLIEELKNKGESVPTIIAGGTPSFPIHAQHDDRILSPGTALFWDAGYASKFKEMDFLFAAVLMCRVASKPGQGLICLDLGHKAIASEMLHPRAKIFGIDDYELITHSEEHMVIKSNVSANIGEILYAIPTHICPTVALHEEVQVVVNNEIVDQWQVVARKRKLEY